MSTLGGSRGERHAKPKFTALDINSLYKSTRGESLEPSTQKNQIPRKHGMQSLGKVPSTRRRPANLPSLKAETQTPGSVSPGQEQGGSQTSVSGANSGQTVAQTANLNSTNSNSLSNTQLQTSASATNSSLSASSYSSSNTGSSSVTWSSVTTGHDAGGSSLPPLYQSPQFQHEFPSLDGSITGSSSHKSSHPKDTHHQQQPQSHQQHPQQQQHHQQHQKQPQNYIDRDGRGESGNCGQSKEGSGDVQQVSLRPQTDAASWIQQQQQSGGGKGGDVLGTSPVPGPLQPVPPQFRALMPSFMYRGSNTMGGNSDQSMQMTTSGARAQTPPHNNQQHYSGSGGGGNQNQPNGNYIMNQGRPQRQIQSGQKDYRTNSPNTTGYQHYNSNNPIMIQKRAPSNRGRSDQDSGNSVPFIEPEVALLQRPIIKEEDLERIESIAKDDGWIRQDEIDYNQKLAFSDDETGDSSQADMKSAFNRNEKMNEKKIGRHDEDNRAAWNRERDRENKDKFERDHNERERNERNERDHRHGVQENISKVDRARDNNIRDRDRDNESVSSSGAPQRDRPQQNGHRVIDAEVVERVKLRKEEEEKREYERKQAANKKLQELEMKRGIKKNDENYEDNKHLLNEDDYPSRGRNYRDNKDRDNRDRDRDRDLRDNRDLRDREMRDRDYNRYEKYERDMNQREREASYKDSHQGNTGPNGRNGPGGGKGSFSTHFQSNLPPRFLRQQQERSGGTSVGGNGLSGPSGINSNSRSITANHQQSQSHYHHGGSEGGQKSIPFAQQYDPRYIHSQNYKQQQLRRNPSDEMPPSRRTMNENYNMSSNAPSRRRGDSEDDERFSNSGRDSNSRNSLVEARGGNITPQLARSISDSSQRKTSVSSSDEQKLTDNAQPSRPESRDFSSWAEETDAELKSRHESCSSGTEKNLNKNDNNSEEIQPRQILQRPQSKSISESGKREETKPDHENKADDSNSSSNMSNSIKQAPSVQPTQILRRSESPKAWSECVLDEQNQQSANKSKDSNVKTEDCSKLNESSLKKNEGIESGDQKENDKQGKKEISKENENSSSRKDDDEKGDEFGNKSHAQKRPSPRGGRPDMRGPPRSYGPYRGGGSWSRRGSNMRMSGGNRNYNDHWSESENSDDLDDDYGRRSERSPKIPRKDLGGKRDLDSRGNHSTKEGFAPRGEPSRRGRGGGSSSSSYRRGGMSSSGPKRLDNYSSMSSKGGYNNSNHSTISNEDKSNSMKKSESTLEDKTKLNRVSSNMGTDGKKSCDNMDEPKEREKTPVSQAPTKRDDKKSPPKTYSSSQYQSQGPRKDCSTSSKMADGPNTSISSNKKDEEVVKRDPTEPERKKSLSKEKEIVREPLPQQRSNSSGHISSSRSVSHVKKDERQPQKPMTKPPPGLGFKQSSTLGQNNSSSSLQHKENSLSKSKSSGDTRSTDSRNTSKTNLPPRLAKQWENRSKRDESQIDSTTNINNRQGNNSAWEKPLQPAGQENKNQSQENESKDQQQASVQQQSSGTEISKQNSTQKTDPSNNKNVLDASSAPVNTIIFENTNYKAVQSSLKRQVSGQSDSSQNNQRKSDDIYKSQSSSSLQEMQQHQQAQQQQQAQHGQQQQNPSQMQSQVVHHQHQHQQTQQQQQSQGQHVPHNQQQQQQEAITTALSQMSFAKSESDYDKEMKLGFPFDTEFSHLTEDKSPASAASKAGLCLPRSSSVIHSATSASQNTISPSTADLNMKIASVKKVWESVPPMPTVLEHTSVAPTDAESHLSSNFVTSQHQHLQHFAAAAHVAAHGGNIHMQHTLSSPGPPSYANTFDPSLDPHFGNKDNVVVGNAGGNQNETDTGGYSPSPQHVGGQGQHPGGGQSNLGLKHAADALSSNNGNVCKVKPNQQQMHQSGLGLSPPPTMQQGTTQLHQAAPQPFYQPSQFGAMPTIPSPPAVLFNSSPMPSQGGLYGPFQIEAGRSQFSQYPGHYGTAGNAGPYSAYMQTPPNMPTAPTPDMYSGITSQFRMGGAVQTPFNQSQQLNNPSTVLISSSSNSLMSASVKPSSQQIGAIGSKSNAAAAVAAAASVAQPYGQQYMNLYPAQQAPPPLQSNSYYSNSAGGQGAFFGGPTAAGATQSYGLQAAAAGIFGGHGGPAPSTAPPQQQIANFSSQFINSPLLTAAAINQFRGGPNPQTAAAYMKSNQGQNHMQDSMGRQLKSPLGTDVSLNLAKQVQPQQSPPHHKNYAPSWDIQNQVMQQQQQSQNQQSSQNVQPQRGGNGPNNLNAGGNVGGGSGRPGQNMQRYPTPIQRPTNYPQHQVPGQQPQPPRTVRQQHSGNTTGGGNSGGAGNAAMNKHYYSSNNAAAGGSRGGHSSNPGDQSGNVGVSSGTNSNKQNSDKNSIDANSTQQEMNVVKGDTSND